MVEENTIEMFDQRTFGIRLNDQKDIKAFSSLMNKVSDQMQKMGYNSTYNKDERSLVNKLSELRNELLQTQNL